MNKILLILMTFFSTLSFSQIDKKYPTDFINQIEVSDISHLFICDSIFMQGDSNTRLIKPEPIGYIGNKYQRFYIHFSSVKKGENNQYVIEGKTRVKNNVCNFNGVIDIKESRVGNIEWIIDSLEYYNTGIIKGTYSLKEDSTQVHSGILNGNFELCFYIDKSNNIRYNALNLGVSDGFYNNQFNGTWISYDNKISLKCCWGDFRIPDSENLDIGAGEFSPSEMYIKNGWQNYMNEVEQWW